MEASRLSIFRKSWQLMFRLPAQRNHKCARDLAMSYSSEPIITAYERGWLAGFRKEVKANPFASETEHHSDYERGFDDGVFSRIDQRSRRSITTSARR
jgi:hypothetical protein